MHQIANKLWVGSQKDFEELDAYGTEWSIVFAARDPWHRQLLGYTGRGAPKDDPEYLFARRGNRLYLNLVDAADPQYIPVAVVDEAMRFIREHVQKYQLPDDPRATLICCNQGSSRAPTLGMLWMARDLLMRRLQPVLSPSDFDEAVNSFTRLYPGFNPGRGMYEFARQNWRYYCDAMWASPIEERPMSDALDKAQAIWHRFCTNLMSDPSLAKDQLIQSIVQALEAGGPDTTQDRLHHGRQDPAKD